MQFTLWLVTALLAVASGSAKESSSAAAPGQPQTGGGRQTATEWMHAGPAFEARPHAGTTWEGTVPPLPPRPPRTERFNDCESALELPLFGLHEYDVSGFGELWFHYVGQGHGIDLRTCYATTTLDTDLDVYDACGGSLLYHYDGGECYVNYGALNYWNFSLEEQHFTFAEGQDYYLVITDRYGRTEGHVTVFTETSPPCAAEALCPDVVACTAPQVQVQVQGNQAELSWAPVPSATDYRVRVADQGYGPYTLLTPSTGGATAWIVPNALNPPRAFYRVEAVCPDETSVPEQEPACINTNRGCAGGFAYFEELVPGQAVCGSMHCDLDWNRDDDWYRFTLAEPAQVRLELTSRCEPLIAYLSTGHCDLSRNDIGEMLQAQESTESMLTTCLAAGSYDVRVIGLGHLDFPCSPELPWHYTIKVDALPCDWVNPCAAPPVLTCGSTEVHGSDAGLQDYDFDESPDLVYRLDIEELSLVDISLCSPQTTIPAFLRLYEECPTDPWIWERYFTSDGPECEYNSFGERPEALLDLPLEPGSYWVTLNSSGHQREGEFGINVSCEAYDCPALTCSGTPEVEPNNGPIYFYGGDGSLGTIAPGETICGQTLAYQGTLDPDVFLLTLTSATSLMITLDCEHFNGYLALVDQAYGLLSEADNAGWCRQELLQTICLVPGDYYVYVSSSEMTGLSTLASYALTVTGTPCTPCPPPNCAGAVPEGEGFYPGFDPPQYDDTTNGGCNYPSAEFTPMSLGQNYCGSFFTFYNPQIDNFMRDMDWFDFTLSQPTRVRFSAYSCAPYQVWVMTDCELQYTYHIFYGSGARSFLTECLPAGHYIGIMTPNSWSGVAYETDWSLGLSALACELSPCPGDAWDSALDIPALPFSHLGSTTGCRPDIGPYTNRDNLLCAWEGSYSAQFCGDSRDVWYRLDLTQETSLTISLCNSAYMTSLGVFRDTGAEPVLSDLVSGNTNGCGQQSELTCTLPAGAYYIVVDGYGTDHGEYRLNITSN